MRGSPDQSNFMHNNERVKEIVDSQHLELELLRAKLKKETAQKRELLNQVLELKGRIRVFVRVRPLRSDEESFQLDIDDEKTLTFYDFLPSNRPTASASSSLMHSNSASTNATSSNGSNSAMIPKKFCFDRVFCPRSTQADVFEEVSSLPSLLLDGYNCCLMAYGQTGSGKTFTMQGSKEDLGMNLRFLREVFEQMNQREDCKYELNLTMLEIYNELIIDLLDDSCYSSGFNTNKSDSETVGITPFSDEGIVEIVPTLSMEKSASLPENRVVPVIGRQVPPHNVSGMVSTNTNNSNNNRLKVRQGPHGNFVPEARRIRIFSFTQLCDVLETGYSMRSVSSTLMNMMSSRSHCVIHIEVISRKCKNNTLTHSQLYLVDLAGSERLASTGVSNNTFSSASNAVNQSQPQGKAVLDETKSINKSLTALSRVMEALQLKQTHIPYRDSTLTFLLKDALGGKSNTCMFVTLSTALESHNQTQCSLKFGTRIRKIEFTPIRKDIELDLRKIANERSQLELKISSLQSKLSEFSSNNSQLGATIALLESQQIQDRDKLEMRQEKIDSLEMEIDSLQELVNSTKKALGSVCSQCTGSENSKFSQKEEQCEDLNGTFSSPMHPLIAQFHELKRLFHYTISKFQPLSAHFFENSEGLDHITHLLNQFDYGTFPNEETTQPRNDLSGDFSNIDSIQTSPNKMIPSKVIKENGLIQICHSSNTNFNQSVPADHMNSGSLSQSLTAHIDALFDKLYLSLNHRSPPLQSIEHFIGKENLHANITSANQLVVRGDKKKTPDHQHRPKNKHHQKGSPRQVSSPLTNIFHTSKLPNFVNDNLGDSFDTLNLKQSFHQFSPLNHSAIENTACSSPWPITNSTQRSPFQKDSILDHICSPSHRAKMSIPMPMIIKTPRIPLQKPFPCMLPSSLIDFSHEVELVEPSAPFHMDIEDFHVKKVVGKDSASLGDDIVCSHDHLTSNDGHDKPNNTINCFVSNPPAISPNERQQVEVDKLPSTSNRDTTNPLNPSCLTSIVSTMSSNQVSEPILSKWLVDLNQRQDVNPTLEEAPPSHPSSHSFPTLVSNDHPPHSCLNQHITEHVDITDFPSTCENNDQSWTRNNTSQETAQMDSAEYFQKEHLETKIDKVPSVSAMTKTLQNTTLVDDQSQRHNNHNDSLEVSNSEMRPRPISAVMDKNAPHHPKKSVSFSNLSPLVIHYDQLRDHVSRLNSHWARPSSIPQVSIIKEPTMTSGGSHHQHSAQPNVHNQSYSSIPPTMMVHENSKRSTSINSQSSILAKTNVNGSHVITDQPHQRLPPVRPSSLLPTTNFSSNRYYSTLSKRSGHTSSAHYGEIESTPYSGARRVFVKKSGSSNLKVNLANTLAPLYRSNSFLNSSGMQMVAAKR